MVCGKLGTADWDVPLPFTESTDFWRVSILPWLRDRPDLVTTGSVRFLGVLVRPVREREILSGRHWKERFMETKHMRMRPYWSDPRDRFKLQQLHVYYMSIEEGQFIEHSTLKTPRTKQDKCALAGIESYVRDLGISGEDALTTSHHRISMQDIARIVERFEDILLHPQP